MTKYLEKDCVSCGARFSPTSGRQRFCLDHRGPKFVTARNTESKQRQRSEPTIEDLTRPPRELKVHGQHRRSQRVGWVRDALTWARRLHQDQRLGASREIVKLAVRTANGEIAIWGCHHLGEMLIHYEMSGFFRSPFARQVSGLPGSKRGQDHEGVSAGQSVFGRAEMSESEAW